MGLESLHNLTILYVEDNNDIRNDAIEFLERYCKKVYEASDGLEALQIFKEERPDIIISDIQMPKLDGLTFAQKVREEDKNTPIIIATAYTNLDYLLKAVELRLIKYLIKPIDFNKLQEALLAAVKSLKEEKSTIVKLSSNSYYDTLNRTLFIDNNLIRFSKNELLFFDYLVRNRERVVTYQEIENLIWPYQGINKEALRTLIYSLRKKLSIDFIENHSGIGYKLKIYS